MALIDSIKKEVGNCQPQTFHMINDQFYAASIASRSAFAAAAGSSAP